MDKVKRMAISVDEEFYTKLRADLPWGLRSALIRALLQAVMDAYEEYGEVAFGAVLSGSFDIHWKIEGRNESGEAREPRGSKDISVEHESS